MGLSDRDYMRVKRPDYDDNPSPGNQPWKRIVAIVILILIAFPFFVC